MKKNAHEISGEEKIAVLTMNNREKKSLIILEAQITDPKEFSSSRLKKGDNQMALVNSS